MEDRKEFEMLLIDTQKEYRRSNKLKDIGSVKDF